MGVNTVETALFENALVVVKKVIEKRYLSNVKKHNKQTYLTFSYLKILNKKPQNYMLNFCLKFAGL
jgi:hypothetical protein